MMTQEILKMNRLKKAAIPLILSIVFNVSPLFADSFSTAKIRREQIHKVNPAVVYVNQTIQAGSQDGSSWSTAYASLAEALSCDLTGKKEIWVAKGTYYPTREKDRNASFTLVPGISIFGGFQGSEVLRAQRNWNKNPTVLSGEIGDPTDMADNVYHVVTGADDAVMDGFTIQDGYAVLGPDDIDDSGCLVEVPEAAGSLENLRIVTNIKLSAGGGLLNVHAGTLTRNCKFYNNYAGKGGAVYNMVTRYWDPGDMDAEVTGEMPFFQNCIFENNHATERGGAVNNDFMTSSTFVSCVFANNSCSAKGGALYADMGSPVYLMNVLFCHNEAERGGALVADGSSSHRMVFTTFIGNMAYDIGAALYQGTYMGEQGDQRSFIGNEVHLYRSVLLSNISISSPSSISNWHDSRVTCDKESIVEYTDGTLAIADYLDEKTYITKSQEFGFHPHRKVDIEYWTEVFDCDENRLYTAYDYDTEAVAGTPGTIYVDGDALEGGDGTSWGTAYGDLNQALEHAVSGSQVWVAQGRYLPTGGTDRSAAFVMKKGVSIYGGFKGTESNLGQRDWQANVTVLSGNIGETDLRSDNVFHVVFGAPDSVLDGFVVQDGQADGDFYNSRGGGLLCEGGASPSILNCIFKDNKAMEGGAIACNEFSAPIMTNCFITGNMAQSGAGILFETGPDRQDLGAKISGTYFLNNTAEDRGGAVYIDYGACPTFTGCTISSNTSSGNGGGVYVDNNSSQLDGIKARFNSCIVTENTTGLRGGAFAVYEGMVIINDSIIKANSAVTGGGGIAVDFLGDYINENSTSVIESNTTTTGEPDIDDERIPGFGPSPGV
ncbi:fibronectin type III domain protein [Desulforapulum autotrophicum HRM2]|uniref:Fibronectin type III domain protein n=1 Tax=Desulforapulum autotrophicum (strain ATCC 43914 / DSM 3382 / VKM B-1955 / HRM2) TaxID=177437 RepID=C0QDF5_DESAH|nr:right-handed parallel beta-helix repeat-containing protein [Desulforapulum autotrophicum]ACN15219.1 fibronectin type III domain protein [Desulforapulum autotrophicum HRM2]